MQAFAQALGSYFSLFILIVDNVGNIVGFLQRNRRTQDYYPHAFLSLSKHWRQKSQGVSGNNQYSRIPSLNHTVKYEKLPLNVVWTRRPVPINTKPASTCGGCGGNMRGLP